MTRKKFSQYRLVHDFIVAFKRLTCDRENVIQEMEDFCRGYREGKAEVWAEMLQLDVEKVIDNAAGVTLAATMNYLKIKPGCPNKGRV